MGLHPVRSSGTALGGLGKHEDSEILLPPILRVVLKCHPKDRKDKLNVQWAYPGAVTLDRDGGACDGTGFANPLPPALRVVLKWNPKDRLDKLGVQ